MINKPLFHGQNIRLTAVNPDTDAVEESRWSHDPCYQQPFFPDNRQPHSGLAFKKQYALLEKKKDACQFAVRLKDNDQLLGFVRFPFIAWSHQAAQIQLAMADLGHYEGWGDEALQLGLNYAFQELNLFRLDAVSPEYDLSLQAALFRANFRLEVRQRAAACHSGNLWDKLRYGLLREEYSEENSDPDITPQPVGTEPLTFPAETTPSKKSLDSNRVTFKGRLTYLRTLEPERDADRLAQWAHDSEYDRLLSGEPARMWTVNQTKEWYEQRINSEQIFMIYTISQDQPVGCTELSDIDPAAGDAWVGIGLGERECWGQGYGTDALEILADYAFRQCNLRRLSLTVFEYNRRAIRSYEKVGFHHEGSARQYIHRDGKRWDMLFMGLYREDWV